MKIWFQSEQANIRKHRLNVFKIGKSRYCRKALVCTHPLGLDSERTVEVDGQFWEDTLSPILHSLPCSHPALAIQSRTFRLSSQRKPSLNIKSYVFFLGGERVNWVRLLPYK